MIRLSVIGNLGQDAEMKEINGKHYASYSVCHTEKNKDGKEFSTWVSVMQSTFDATPKVLQYLTKGTKVYVEGNPTAGAYIAKDGNAKANLSLWAHKMELLGGRSEPPQGFQAQQRQKQTEEADAPYIPQEDPEDTDLPF